ncbi:MAG: nucleotide sugar dehydrogenase, partial [Atopobiaceae bacterium]|nr:nucleotide sugar dehydrogenase [Atopobiaceae bacterium]
MDYTVAIVGAGYVGISLATLLAQRNSVRVMDVDERKIAMLKKLESPLAEAEIQELLTTGTLDITPTSDPVEAYSDADFVVVAVSTDYDSEHGRLDTTQVENVVRSVRDVTPDAVIVIRSTVAVGYTADLASRFPEGSFLFSPEFLREGKALHDNLHPSRIIVGIPQTDDPDRADALREQAERFADLLLEGSLDADTPVCIMGSTEAEAVKLFSNTYLALRVAFFNELDTYADVRGLDAARIIEGVCLDPRVGDFYNNPSFGYGGYCLPKDTKQLLANYRDIPQNLIGAIVEANRTRKDHIAGTVYAELKSRFSRIGKPVILDDEAGGFEGQQDAGTAEPLVGIYRISMKAGSDNYRQSSMLGIIERLADRGVHMLI